MWYMDEMTGRTALRTAHTTLLLSHPMISHVLSQLHQIRKHDLPQVFDSRCDHGGDCGLRVTACEQLSLTFRHSHISSASCSWDGSSSEWTQARLLLASWELEPYSVWVRSCCRGHASADVLCIPSRHARSDLLAPRSAGCPPPIRCPIKSRIFHLN
jgi:hypothetical protein